MSLAEQIRTIEERFGEFAVRSGEPREHKESSRLLTGWAEIDAALGGGLTMAGLHEWFGVAPSKHFVACQGGETRRSAWTPPLAPLVHLVRQAMSCASFLHRAVWIGRRCFPYGGVLMGPSGDRRLLDRSLFVAADGPADRLWAADLALRSPTVGLVIADGSGFDMAATRRIQLVAKAHRTPALLARPPWETRELSAAQTRWLVRWAERDQGGSVPSPGQVYEESSSCNPRWSLELLRCKGMQPDSCPRVWALEWDRGEGAVRLSTAVAHQSGDARASTNDRRLQRA
ncbi:MAG: hypothetical protein Q7R41_19785 [Phycisphaerales bacterium]|nr:hypothetical protein [Phycisphaerales bacterium]